MDPQDCPCAIGVALAPVVTTANAQTVNARHAEKAVVPVAHLDASSVPKDVSAKDNLPPNAAAANNVCNFPS
ncbi:unnamed protein product [Natator depressus]